MLQTTTHVVRVQSSVWATQGNPGKNGARVRQVRNGASKGSCSGIKCLKHTPCGVSTCVLTETLLVDSKDDTNGALQRICSPSDALGTSVTCAHMRAAAWAEHLPCQRCLATHGRMLAADKYMSPDNSDACMTANIRGMQACRASVVRGAP
jgi:hypothetical protein